MSNVIQANGTKAANKARRANKEDESKGRVLFVAYPLLPVTETSSGGAEQVLRSVEREAHKQGWNTTLAACSGSKAAGTVYNTMAPCSAPLQNAIEVEEEHAREVKELVSVRAMIGRGFDLVHDHSGSFFTHAARVNAPVLATLHLPRYFYPEYYFRNLPSNVHLVCVSKTQARDFSSLPQFAGTVPNGIQLDKFIYQARKGEGLLWLGRICEEKGTHIALDVAAQSGMKITIAGSVYPFRYHQEYFEREIAPRLVKMGEQATFVESPSLKDKVRLLRDAKAVLVTSTAEETSSLVAMEAAACGTPVVAFRRGALPEVVLHGTTGYIVADKQQMVATVKLIGRILPSDCREFAVRNFDVKRMFEQYEALYLRYSRKDTADVRQAEMPVQAAA